VILSEVIDRLVDIFDTALSVPVYDGPVPTASNHAAFLAVGASGTDDEGATADLEPSTTGPGTWHDESGSVTCSAWAWSGGTDIAARRAEALTIAEGALAALWADRTLGGLLVTPGAVSSAVTYDARQTDSGPIVRVTFTVAYQALVT
jgi:hypothetical protein